MKKLIILFFIFFLAGCVFDRNIERIYFQPEVSVNVDKETQGTFAFHPGTEMDIDDNNDTNVVDDASILLPEVMPNDIDSEDVMSDTDEKDIATTMYEIFITDNGSGNFDIMDNGARAIVEETSVYRDVQETIDVPSVHESEVVDNSMDAETTFDNEIVDTYQEDFVIWFNDTNDVSDDTNEMSNEDSTDTPDIKIEEIEPDTTEVADLIELPKCQPVDCDDKNPCTNDSCDPQIGCLFVTNMNPCDDKNWCTNNDVCTLGTCKGSLYICVIPESIPCYIGVCNPSKSECVFNKGDNDQDGIPGGCDPDLDNDGIPNIVDTDDDNDGILDDVDNCSWKFNPAQVDNDGDGLGFGDTCDPDGNNG